MILIGSFIIRQRTHSEIQKRIHMCSYIQVKVSRSRSADVWGAYRPPIGTRAVCIFTTDIMGRAT